MRIKFLLAYLVIVFSVASPFKVEAREIVCNSPKFSTRLDSLSSRAYGQLEKKEWQILVMENKKTKTNTIDNAKRGLSLYKTQQILGFSGHKIKTACNGKAEHWIWVDQENNKKIVQIIFFDKKINILKGKGF